MKCALSLIFSAVAIPDPFLEECFFFWFLKSLNTDLQIIKVLKKKAPNSMDDPVSRLLITDNLAKEQQYL